MIDGVTNEIWGGPNVMARDHSAEMDVDHPSQAIPRQDREALEKERDEKYEVS